MKEGVAKANPVLLEPIMKVDITVPEEYMGDVIGDVNSRRGQVLGTEQRPRTILIKSLIPLENLFGYISDLRGKTKGQGTASMEFYEYSEVPRNIQEKIIQERNS
jgi:elongation factor G